MSKIDPELTCSVGTSNDRRFLCASITDVSKLREGMAEGGEEFPDFLLSRYVTSSAICKLQEVLFWRRPLALALVFVIVDSIFTLVYALRLSFLSTILFLCVVSNIVRFVYEFAGTGVDLWLFEAPRPPDDPNQSNRVRTPEEVDATICYWQANGRRFGEWFRNYIAEPSWGKHAMFFGAVFIVFVVAMAVGTFSIVAIIVHAILVLPGLLLNPAVRGFVSERIRRAKEVKRQAITPSAPNDKETTE